MELIGDFRVVNYSVKLFDQGPVSQPGRQFGPNVRDSGTSRYIFGEALQPPLDAGVKEHAGGEHGHDIDDGLGAKEAAGTFRRLTYVRVYSIKYFFLYSGCLPKSPNAISLNLSALALIVDCICGTTLLRKSGHARKFATVLTSCSARSCKAAFR